MLHDPIYWSRKKIRGMNSAALANFTEDFESVEIHTIYTNTTTPDSLSTESKADFRSTNAIQNGLTQRSGLRFSGVDVWIRSLVSH